MFELFVKQLEQETFYNMYGGILFVGVALGILFILSTVMIIYYKQISEGYTVALKIVANCLGLVVIVHMPLPSTNNH